MHAGFAIVRWPTGWRSSTQDFVEHTGLRTERMGEMSALLKEQLGVEEKPSFHELGAYVKWLQQAEKGRQ